MTHTATRLIVLILSLCVGIVDAADPVPIVDAKLSTEGEVWQGERVVVSLTLKTPDSFASAPAFDLPQVPGVILIPPAGSPVLGTETIGDDSYTTQTHELNAFPQQAGQLKIPRFTIRFDSSLGFGKPVQSRTVTTTEISFAVKRPPGTEQQSVVLTTTNLKVAESWKPKPTKQPVSTGDTFVRTVQVQADNLAGMVLPSLRIKAPEGLRVYDQPPSLNDQNQRGDLTGSRTETSTIVCEKAGAYALPAMTLKWWNPEAQKLQDVTLPAHEITVADSPNIEQQNESSLAATSTSGSKTRFPIAIAGFVILLMVGYFVWQPAEKCLQVWQTNLMHSERQEFANLTRACRSGNAKAIYCAIQTWRGKIDAASQSQSISPIPCFERDSELMKEYELLDAALYGGSASAKSSGWSATRLLTCLTQFRTRWKREQAASVKKNVLPELNSQLRT